MKSAGKARNNGLYRHIRTSKEIIRNLLNDSLKFLKSDGGKKTLNTSSIKNFDELPLFLNAQLISRTLGISPSSAYELLHEDGFPSLRIGSRLVVPKEQFRLWVERQTGGAHEE